MIKTEKQICETLITLMQEKPYAQIKVAELCRAAEISRSTFYVYFDSVEDVLQSIEDDFLSHLEDEKTVSKEYAIDKADKNLSYVRDHMDIFETLTGPNGDPYFAMRIGNRSKRIFYDVIKGRDTKLSKAQLEMINEYSRAGKMQVFRWWGEHKNEVSIKEIIDTLDQLEQAVRHIVSGK